MAKIIQKYFWDSILYTYMLRYVLEYDKIEEFRWNYLKGLSNNDLNQSLDAINSFKENIDLYISEDYRFIDTKPFIETIEHIENYYRGIMPDEFDSFRWYQYSCLFFSYIFFSLQHNDEFKSRYLFYLDNEILENKWSAMLNPDMDFWFNRLGYWMATWCGKTLLMYAIVYMYCKLFATDTKTLYIVVPTDELRKQHKMFLSLFAENHYWSINDKGTVVDFDHIPFFWDHSFSWKLSTLKWFEGAELSNNSIFLMDEAHKWASNDTWAMECLKNKYIDKDNTMLFEFSATFQEAFKNEKEVNLNENIFDYYHFSSIYKYNLFDFNSDWFGKDYIVSQVKKTTDTEAEDKKDLICNSLVGYSLQLKWYRTLKRRSEWINALWIEKESYLECQHWLQKWLRMYKPLFLWLSWKLDDSWKEWEWSETTLVKILEHFSYIFSHLEEYRAQIEQQQIQLEEFYNLLTWLEYKKWDRLWLQIRYDKQNDEIKLWLWKNIMLINTWKNAAIAEKLKTIVEWFSYQDFGIASQKQFNNVDKNWDILFLFWSRKFIEWWDSKRPSTILLFKMGSSSTVLATQILWRWLRLYWIKWDWYRHLNYSTKAFRDRNLEPLEQVRMYWYDIDQFNKFIEDLAGNGYRVSVIKKREYSDSFKTFLLKNDIEVTDDNQIGKLFEKKFKHLDDILNEWEEINIQVEKLEIEIQKWKLYFVYLDNEKWIKKRMWELRSQYEDLSEFTKKSMEKGMITDTKTSYTPDVFDKTYWEIFWKDNTHKLVNKLLSEQKLYKLSTEDIENVANFVETIAIKTDKLLKNPDSKEQLFEITKQNKIINYFIENLQQEFVAIWNRIKNYKVKWITTEQSFLKLTNLISEIRLEFPIDKNDDNWKSLIALFFRDSSKFSIEENYEDLDWWQRRAISELFHQKNDDLHIYDRLYYISPDNDNSLHDIKNSDIHVKTPKFLPNDLNINCNEEDKIENMLKRIQNNKELSEKYDIFYLRNLVWKQWIKLKYEDVNWEFSNFFPDFLVRFISKTDENDITVVYLEPKWDWIDKNWERKSERLREITSLDVDQKIKNVFWIPESENWDQKYTWLKVLWVMQFQN